MNRADYADLAYFLAIAKHRSFRQAGLEVGVSASALSHAIKGLEARLGIRLLNRTNRSVMLTSAGEDLREAIEQPFGAIGEAVDGLNRYRDAPLGRIRLNAIGHAVAAIMGPVLPIFAERYPDIDVEVSSSNRMLDVVGAGFDAGIRYGGTIPEDMIAQRISADVRWVVAASPEYLERCGTPVSPNDLEGHHCIGVRLGDDTIYKWEFAGADGREFSIAVPCRFIVDDSNAIVALAKGGIGLGYGDYSMFASSVESGELRLVLEDWSVTSPGYHIYYSSRRQVPVGLKLLIDLIREIRPLGY